MASVPCSESASMMVGAGEEVELAIVAALDDMQGEYR